MTGYEEGGSSTVIDSDSMCVECESSHNDMGFGHAKVAVTVLLWLARRQGTATLIVARACTAGWLPLRV